MTINRGSNKSQFSKLHHISVVVRNMEESVKFYESIGIGPFVDYPPLKEYVKINGFDETGFFNLKFKTVQIGDIQLQLCQPGEGESPYKDFSKRKGEGVYHLGFVVDDVDDSETRLKRLGLKVLSSGRRADGSGFSYMDTAGKAGVVLLVRQNKGPKNLPSKAEVKKKK
jgi:catechol 2,3-dioxygenase-like lactoylglutathione lyase family enzyme